MGSPLRTRLAADDAWALMSRMVQANRGRRGTVLASLELSPPQAQALRFLQEDEPCAMSELAGQLCCDNSNVTGIVDRLERRGLVERRPADHDRRVKLLQLTPEGAALREEALRLLDAAPDGLRALSDDEQRQLAALLSKALGD
jgi:DNA-binding MarR family transcriptional regulator